MANRVALAATGIRNRAPAAAGQRPDHVRLPLPTFCQSQPGQHRLGGDGKRGRVQESIRGGPVGTVALYGTFAVHYSLAFLGDLHPTRSADGTEQADQSDTRVRSGLGGWIAFVGTAAVGGLR
jgi:hypothetical protein